ncbi:MAG: hypothetical protein CVV13_03695 [Gammaproteobacteria bacterium HGW-Gammaproteobacteria-3]|nr:MAG: hypothetical protein CVV13_03695 [Gammaproteobacteria bacterium HGW-Gammaproteobacteria-3]
MIQANTFTSELLFAKDIPTCVQLIQANFEELQHHSELIDQWFTQRIVHNPWQTSLAGIGVGIRHHGRLIACRAIFAQPWWLQGRSTVIAFCANTAVDRNYRGQGLASLLMEASSQLAHLTGSTTAGAITQKAYNKLSYQAIGGTDNDFYRLRSCYSGSAVKHFGKYLGVGVGRLLNIGLQLRERRHKPSQRFYLQAPRRCGQTFDELWQRARNGYGSCLERSSAYLNWRLFDAPTCPLKLSALRDDDGLLRAYAIWHATEFPGAIRMAVLRDLFCPVEDETSIQALLYLLINNWRASGISWISLEVSAPHLTEIFAGNGYEWVPSRGNRYYIHSDTPLDDHTLAHWFRSGLDGDYFDLPFK